MAIAPGLEQRRGHSPSSIIEDIRKEGGREGGGRKEIEGREEGVKERLGMEEEGQEKGEEGERMQKHLLVSPALF